MAVSDLLVEVETWQGEWFTLYGAGQGDRGVVLGERPIGLLSDEPMESIWNSHAFQTGASFGGIRIDKKDVMIGAEIIPTENESWHENYSGWKDAWSATRDNKLWVTTPESRRFLLCRKAKAPGFDPERDPFVRQHSRVDTFLTAGDPRWKEPDQPLKWVNDIDTTDVSGGEVWSFHDFWVSNPTDYPLWPMWELQAYEGAKWRLPDYSFGSDLYERADLDANRTIQMPALIAGEHVRVDTTDEGEQVVSSIDTQIYQRMAGVRFLYPIPAKTKKPVKLTVGVTRVPAGVGIRLVLRRNWSSPLLIG
ncbi:phage tail protein [Nocardia cyriacigeorgica]|uniref:phage tail protein n=1 Tax=Nocardia cyriacigeorgica TaxID=135487 RepID=UPI002455B4A2|nr:phage tail protein [Nocardia cyriacigeorgica]